MSLQEKAEYFKFCKYTKKYVKEKLDNNFTIDNIPFILSNEYLPKIRTIVGLCHKKSKAKLQLKSEEIYKFMGSKFYTPYYKYYPKDLNEKEIKEKYNEFNN